MWREKNVWKAHIKIINHFNEGISYYKPGNQSVTTSQLTGLPDLQQFETDLGLAEYDENFPVSIAFIDLDAALV